MDSLVLAASPTDGSSTLRHVEEMHASDSQKKASEYSLLRAFLTSGLHENNSYNALQYTRKPLFRRTYIYTKSMLC